MSVLSKSNQFLSRLLRLPLAGPVFRLYAPRVHREKESKAPQWPRVLVANLMPTLGDTICYLVIADVLREAIPNVHITFLVDSAVASVVQMHAGINNVVPVTTPNRYLRRLPTIKMYYRLYRAMRTVFALSKEQQFDYAILPRGGVDPSLTAHAVWMMHIPRSAGYSRHVESNDINHNFGDPLLTDLITRITKPHEASRALYLLEILNLVPDATKRWTPELPIAGVQAISRSQDKQSLLAKAGIPENRLFIVISPGAGLPRRMWSENKFLQLCQHILAETEYEIVLNGSSSEHDLCEHIVRTLGPRAHNTAGKLNLKELIGLLAHATAFVGNDSGPGHVAGALGVPVISLHMMALGAETSESHHPDNKRPVGPFVTVIRPRHFLAPCQNKCESPIGHCINTIEVAEVWAALLKQPNFAKTSKID